MAVMFILLPCLLLTAVTGQESSSYQNNDQSGELGGQQEQVNDSLNPQNEAVSNNGDQPNFQGQEKQNQPIQSETQSETQSEIAADGQIIESSAPVDNNPSSPHEGSRLSEILEMIEAMTSAPNDGDEEGGSNGVKVTVFESEEEHVEGEGNHEEDLSGELSNGEHVHISQDEDQQSHQESTGSEIIVEDDPSVSVSADADSVIKGTDSGVIVVPSQSSNSRPLKVKVLVKDGYVLNLSSGVGSVSVSSDKSMVHVRAPSSSGAGGVFDDSDTIGPYIVVNEGEGNALIKRPVSEEETATALKMYREMEIVGQAMRGKGVAGMVGVAGGPSATDGVFNSPQMIQQSAQPQPNIAQGQAQAQAQQLQLQAVQQAAQVRQLQQLQQLQVQRQQQQQQQMQQYQIQQRQMPQIQQMQMNQFQLQQQQMQQQQGNNGVNMIVARNKMLMERNVLIAKMAKKVAIAVIKTLVPLPLLYTGPNGVGDLNQPIYDDSTLNALFDNL